MYENKYFILTIFQIKVSYLKSFKNSQKFIIVSFISNLYKNYFLKKKAIRYY